MRARNPSLIKKGERADNAYVVDLWGAYRREIEDIPLLEREEEQELARQSQNGNEEARQKLVKHNLRFVLSRATEYVGYLNYDRSLTWQDLFQWGVLGLIIAARKYESRGGVKFISYAVWDIDAQIRDSLSHHRLIRIKHTGRKLIREYTKAESAIKKSAEAFGGVDYVPIDEVADMLDMSVEDATLANEWRTLRDTVRLDDIVSEEAGLIEYDIPDKDEASPDLILESTRRLELLLKRLTKILHRDVDLEIVLGRFGFDSDEEISCIELGNKLGLEKSRVSQLCLKLLRKMRNDPVMFELSGGDPYDDRRFWI